MCRHKSGDYYVWCEYQTAEGFWTTIVGKAETTLPYLYQQERVTTVEVTFECNEVDCGFEQVEEMHIDKVALWIQNHEEGRCLM